MHHERNVRCPKLSNRIKYFIIEYDPPDPELFPYWKPRKDLLSDIEHQYMVMYRALNKWHVVPWIDPITGDTYPEIRLSMLQIDDWIEIRKRNEEKKAAKRAEKGGKGFKAIGSH